MNPWWLRPPAEEGPSNQEEPKKPARKTQEKRQPEQQEKRAAPGKRPSGRGRSPRRGRSPADKSKRQNGGQRRIVVFYDVDSTNPGIDRDLILRRVAEKGRVIAKRAYGDWHRHGDQEKGIREAGLEIVDLPRRQASGQGGAGIKLAVDAVDFCVTKEPCEVFVIVSSNPDFSPLVAKLQEAKIEVLGIGMRETASAELAAMCDEYLYIDELGRKDDTAVVEVSAEKDDSSVDEVKAPVFALLVEVFETLEAQGGGPVWGSMLKQEMRRSQPGLDMRGLGYATFTDLLEDAERHEVIRLERDDRSGSYYVAGLARE